MLNCIVLDENGVIIGRVGGLSSLDIGWESRGGIAAGELPIGKHSHLSQPTLLPYGTSCWYQFDLSGYGLEEVPCLRGNTLTRSGTDRTLHLIGPRDVIGGYSVSAGPITGGSAAHIVAQQIGLSAAPLRMQMGLRQEGLGGVYAATGGTLREMWDGLSDTRGEGYYIRAKGFGLLQWIMDWYWWGNDLTGRVNLVEGRNVEIESATYNLFSPGPEAVAAGFSLWNGGEATAYSVRTPQRVLGRGEAIRAASRATAIAEVVSGRTPIVNNPSLMDRAAVESSARAELARNMHPVSAVEVSVTDPTDDIINLRPWDLVSVSFPTEDTGMFRSGAVGFIRSKSIRVQADRGRNARPMCKLGVELWATGAAAPRYQGLAGGFGARVGFGAVSVTSDVVVDPGDLAAAAAGLESETVSQTTPPGDLAAGIEYGDADVSQTVPSGGSSAPVGLTVPDVYAQPLWWAAGGATGCIGAWQAKGAASLAASKSDLSGNGNQLDNWGPRDPSWSTGSGWGFDLNLGGQDILYCSNIVGVENWVGTVIVQFTGASGDMAMPLYLDSVVLTPLAFTGQNAYWACLTKSYSDTPTSYGNMALTPTKAFMNGTSVGTLSGSSGPIVQGFPLGIGGSTEDGASGTVTVVAAAVYDNALTDGQIAAVAAAMAAL